MHKNKERMMNFLKNCTINSFKSPNGNFLICRYLFGESQKGCSLLAIRIHEDFSPVVWTSLLLQNLEPDRQFRTFLPEVVLLVLLKIIVSSAHLLHQIDAQSNSFPGAYLKGGRASVFQFLIKQDVLFSFLERKFSIHYFIKQKYFLI